MAYYAWRFMTFKSNEQGDGHISDIVYDNLPMFGI